MSCQDIIIVKPVEFVQRKDIAIDASIVEKYKSFFQQYNCFSDNAVVVVQPVISKVIKRHPIASSKKDKSVKKIMLGILNVINETNYKKMLLKAKIFVSSDNLKEVFQEILEKCSFQVFYLSIYSSFIKDLVQSLSDSERQVAMNVINQFLSEFIKEGYMLQIPKTEDSYHDFCIMQKNKMLIVSKTMILIELSINTTYVTIVTLQAFTDKVFSDLLNEMNKPQNNSEIISTFLQILLELAKQNVHLDKSKLMDISTIQTNQKIKFMIIDLIR